MDEFEEAQMNLGCRKFMWNFVTWNNMLKEMNEDEAR